MTDAEVALVTGASRGIGRATAIALAERGCDVAVNYWKEAGLAEGTAHEVERRGRRAVIVQGDVSSVTDVDACFAVAESVLGPVSILVNNAGTRVDGLAVTMPDRGWERVLNTNLSGSFFCARRALKSMLRQRRGRIVNVASVAGLVGSPGQVNYSAAKAGVIGLTKTLAREVGGRGITVNAVAPGPVDTDLIGDLTEGQRERLLESVPLSRVASAGEVAAVIVGLCESTFVNGAVVVVDGGMTA